jgi:hypothetical protein
MTHSTKSEEVVEVVRRVLSRHCSGAYGGPHLPPMDVEAISTELAKELKSVHDKEVLAAKLFGRKEALTEVIAVLRRAVYHAIPSEEGGLKRALAAVEKR